jgi:spermidine synthase
MLSDRKINRVLLLLASLSGAAALVYETIWMRWFRLAFGSTSHAASATLCAYFLGLAIGAALVGRLAGRSARPLRLYGGVEVAAAGAALLVPLALRAYDGIYPALYERLAGAPPLFLAVKVGMALAAMLPCAVLLGGSLPPLVAACLGRDGDLARGGAVVYWANLVGSVLGAVAGGLVLPESIGVPGTYAAGVAGSTAAGLGALWLDRKNGVERASTPASAEPGARETAPAAALAVAGVSGFGLLAFEVLLIHALGRFFAHSTYSFGLVLAVVLLCLAAGAAAVAWSRDRLPAAQLLRGVLLVEAALLFALPWAVIGLRDLLETRPELAAVFESPLARGVLAVGLLGAPALLVAALIFPLTFRMASGGPAGPRLGRLLAANTLGGIAGSLAASFVLLETLGLWASFGALGLLYAISAPWLAPSARSRAAWAAAAAAVSVAFAATPLSPWRLPACELRDGEQLLASSEGADGLVTVIEHKGVRFVAIDEHYQFGDTSASALYQRMGRLPLLLHPDPKRVLVIGSATGGLAAGAVAEPVDEIVLVEILSALHPLAATWFPEHNQRVHSDPRTRLVTEDGRNYLRATRERYDVIVEDLFVPHMPSATAMYTRDHYREALAHLGAHGVFCQWLPLYQLSRAELAIIVATFTEVFPGASLWTPSFRPVAILGLVGIAGAAPSADALEARARSLVALGVHDPWLTDPIGLWSFHLGAGSSLRQLLGPAAIHSDARPGFEFVAARTSLHVQAEFAGAGWPLLAQQLIDLGEQPAIFRGAPRDPARGGEVLAAANRLAASGRGAEARRYLARAAQLIPASLLAERDDSISLVWPTPDR